MKKLHFGCGPHRIDGWENYDRDVDLTKPLPFDDNSVDYIFSEHVVEHLTPQEAWRYFEECFRILTHGGVVRTTVPDVYITWNKMTSDYLSMVKQRGWGDGSPKSGIQHLVFNHGHQSLWSIPVLEAVHEAIGFEVHLAEPYKSVFLPLANLEQHGIDLGKENNLIESISIDALKP